MKNKIYKYDFLVVGGGLVGSLAAIALFQNNYKVLLLDKNKFISKDNRTLAVNANSMEFLDKLGLWKKLKTEVEPIKKIIIKDFLNTDDLILENKDESMGSVIFNSSLLKIARNYLLTNKILIPGLNFNSIDIKPNKNVIINKKIFNFKKIIIATGKNYENDEILKKIKFTSSHRAYVGFFHHEKIHNQVAYEIFTPNGPLAVLPSPNKSKKVSTFIYSTKKDMESKSLISLIIKHFNKSHSKIKLTNTIGSFPISPHISKPISKDFLLLGDAAHSIHPVAGQGWNLGVKDIQVLCENLNNYDIDDLNFDEIYLSKRIFENFTYLNFTSLINFLYEDQRLLSKIFIKTSFSILNKIPFIKKIFIKQAMGRMNLV